MNGGSLLAQTYWEVVARSQAGDVDGAYERLRRFAQRWDEISWVGDNAADIHGDMVAGDGEAYLADMVVTASSVIHGIMGIQPSWNELKITPNLPSGWYKAQANIIYKGVRHQVRIEGDQITIEPLEKVYNFQ